ncbi:MAG: penicillin-insensitive murein endopeptidase [Pyrinomonadaceae bacterium]
MGYVIRTNRRSGFFRIPDNGLGYYLGRKAAGRLWGQPFLILFLLELGERWNSLPGNSPFGIGDIGEEDGRPMPDHNTHRFGSAVDLFIFHKHGLERNDRLNAVWVRDPNYDADRTLQFVKLIKEFSLRYGMQQILFNDDDVNRQANMIGSYPRVLHDRTTANSKGQHEDHIHITFTGKAPYANREIVEMLESMTSPYDWEPGPRCHRYGDY